MYSDYRFRHNFSITYFLYSRERDKCKIGYTTDIYRRIKQLSLSDYDIIISNLVFTAGDSEAYYLKLFSQYSLDKSEWYHRDVTLQTRSLPPIHIENWIKVDKIDRCFFTASKFICSNCGNVEDLFIYCKNCGKHKDKSLAELNIEKAKYYQYLEYKQKKWWRIPGYDKDYNIEFENHFSW